MKYNYSLSDKLKKKKKYIPYNDSFLFFLNFNEKIQILELKKYIIWNYE